MAVQSKGPKRAPRVAPKAIRPKLRVPCDPRSAHDWRFNLEGTVEGRHTESIVTTKCQGNVIPRKMYTTTWRMRNFNMCRRHQVEVGSMKGAHQNKAREGS